MPTPRYVVLYNGKEEQPDQKELKLTDSFESAKESHIEVKALMLNINYGHNTDLLGRSKTLRGYSHFVSIAREYRETMPIREAVKKAVDRCIKENMLADYLIGRKAEVTEMCITEYNEQETQQAFFEEGVTQGRAAALVALVRKNLLSIEQAAGELG